MFILAIILTVMSSLLTHVGIRDLTGGRRQVSLLAASVVFLFACNLASAFDGYWSGFYTMLSVYFMGCILSPWLVFRWKGRSGA
ncbi:MAG: hypothetical protein AAF680_06875 [Pseudomonadota bacterium]